MKAPLIEVASYDELRAKTAALAPRHRFYWRGQVRHHGRIVSSRGRKLEAATLDDVWKLYGHRVVWMQAAEAIAAELFPTSPAGGADRIPAALRPLLATAILQHYGFQTHFIDVTPDIDVALCFALFEYHDYFPLLEGRGNRRMVTRIAWYEPSREPHGFLYAFDRPLWSPEGINHGDAIDLTALVRPGFNRMQQQRAAALYCERKPGEISNLVHTVFKFPNPLPGARPAVAQSILLFPNPGTDPIYRQLLESRFVKTYVADFGGPFVRRTVTKGGEVRYTSQTSNEYAPVELYVRPLDIPEYHPPDLDPFEFKLFRSLDRILTPTFYFEWAKQRLRWKRWPSVQRDFKRAQPILVNTSLHDMRERTNAALLTKRSRQPRWASNIFLEFNPSNFAGPYASDRAVRGIWLFGDGRSFVINVFGAQRGRPWMGELTLFEWTKTAYTQIHESGPDMRGFLALALSLIDEVRHRRLKLIRPKRKSEYAQMIWDPTSRG